MGNMLAFCMTKDSIPKAEKKVLQVMKMDNGKIMEFRGSIRVKDLLKNYPNSYVGIFMEATQPLPLDYKLKIGKIYYLLPCFNTTFETTTLGVKRIKVVITRQQLQRLLSNQMTVEDMFMEIEKRPCKPVSCLAKTCSQILEAIPEEN